MARCVQRIWTKEEVDLLRKLNAQIPKINRKEIAKTLGVSYFAVSAKISKEGMAKRITKYPKPAIPSAPKIPYYGEKPTLPPLPCLALPLPVIQGL